MVIHSKYFIYNVWWIFSTGILYIVIAIIWGPVFETGLKLSLDLHKICIFKKSQQTMLPKYLTVDICKEYQYDKLDLG